MKDQPSHPAASYAEAVERIEALQRLDGPEINPVSHTQFYTHAKKTERVVLWFHGYTNSPAQFSALGRLCHARGANVFIPRCPHHGLKDRMTTETALLTEKELRRFAAQSLDIAAGLGERLTVGGISMGGVLSAWAAQARSEVDLALLIAPLFGIQAVPIAQLPLAMWLYRLRPNQFRWWDPITQDSPGAQMHTYPRFSTRGLAHIALFSLAVQAAARRARPAARRIRIVLNESDHAIDLPQCARVEQWWRARGADVQTYTFPRALDLDHDMIDPLHAKQNTAAVYPELLRLLEF